MKLSQLEYMKELTLDEIDKSKLVDITNINIDYSLTVIQRMENYLEQIKNPYCFLCGDTAVKINFENDCKDLTSALKNYFINIKKS